jgi:alpha-glucosidase
MILKSKVLLSSGYLLMSCLLLFALPLSAKEFFITSPDKKIKAHVEIDKHITYRIAFNNVIYLQPSVLSMKLDKGTKLGVNPVIKNTAVRTVNNVLHTLYGISKSIAEQYNELRIDLAGNYSIIFRVYNEGFAWRFITDFPDSIVINREQAEFNFTEDYPVYFHPSMSESFYRLQKITDRKLQPNYSSLPVLVKPDSSTSILIHEADLSDYPCLTVFSDSLRSNGLTGSHSLYPKTAEPGGYKNFNLVVKETENYLAKTTGKRNFPWRIIAFAENDKDILVNQLMYLLAREREGQNWNWVKPGKVAWDWWNALNLTGVTFKTGINTQTYKYYIDFAAKNGIEYVNIDEGWSDNFDLLKVKPAVDIEELVRYAKSKKVGIFLWCVWWTIDRQMKEALDQFEKWGIAGIKVDFMDRDDQVVVNFEERLLKEAAKRKILVNYHGAYHPTGFQRTYPNNINTEGVRGLEWNKFDPGGVTPDHDVTIPFIRMFAGAMDYTPGAMNNYNSNDWKQINDRPASQGTRCHQLAMYINYFAPLQMLSDAPTAYKKEPEFLNFLAGIPTVWDSSVPLESRVGKYMTMARKKGDNWYVGSLTNWDKRSICIKLDFLEADTEYAATLVKDGVNASRIGNDYSIVQQTFKRGDTLNINMAEGGGFAMRMVPEMKQTDPIAGQRRQYRIIMFGNSLIENGGDWAKRLNQADVRNSGRGGFTTSHFVWLLNDHVIKYKPKICFLEGGINDIGAGIPLERIKQNYQSMIDTLLAHHIRPVLNAVLYTNQPGQPEDRKRNADMIDDINTYLRKLSQENNIPMIDLNPQLSNDRTLASRYTTDGVHLTEKAYAIWVQAIQNVLSSIQ